MSGLRPYVLEEEPQSPVTLLSSPPPPSRRHQQQQQQSSSISASSSAGAATADHPRDQYHDHLSRSSDASASDFSELELHQRDVPSSSSGGEGVEDYADYVSQLPTRWDLSAHWHMGEYYSEGVEGDADDDDDEERDPDTDLSEGPGPGLRAGHRTNAGTRQMHLDMGRVRDILSSPVSTSIDLSAGLSSRGVIDDSTAGTGVGTSARTGGTGSILNNQVIDGMADIDSLSSSASEGIFSRHHHQQYHRAYPSRNNSSERAVRFSRDTAPPPPTRAPQTPQLAADNSTSTPTLEPITPEPLPPASGSITGNITTPFGSDDIAQTTRSLTEGFGETLGSLNHYRSATRPQMQISSTTGQERDSSLGGGFDHSGQSRVHSPSRLMDFVGQGSSRTQFVRYPFPPGGGNGQSRLASGSGGGSSLQQQNHHHLFALASSSRHGQAPSPRGHLSPYWGALERYRRQGSQSPRYSSTSSSSSSTSSSRVTSPVLGPQSALLKSQDAEAGIDEGGLVMEQKDEGYNLNQTTTCNTPATATGAGGANRQTNGMSQGGSELGRQQQGSNRTGSSILVSNNDHKVTSLPSFASSIFMPNILGSTVTTGEAYSPSGLYRRPKSNHPRRPCCFLQAGQKFSGNQSLKLVASTLSGMRSRLVEEWNVKVSISAVDYVAGTVYGHMEAMDVPMSVSNVVTFWEGEIIDFENHTLWTRKWSAKERTDLDHWRRLEAFRGMDEKYIIKGAENGRFRGHIAQKYIFMRWKEKHFVNVSEHTSGLTIAGFYYLSMRRSDGYVEGFYHDQASTPYQHLALNPTFETAGFSSSIFELA